MDFQTALKQTRQQLKNIQNEQIECNICSQGYNVTLNLPFQMQCGHTICRSCLSQLQKCPFDRKIIESSTVNVVSLIITQFKNTFYEQLICCEFCEVLKKQGLVFYTDEKKLVCLDCLIQSKINDNNKLEIQLKGQIYETQVNFHFRNKDHI